MNSFYLIVAMTTFVGNCNFLEITSIIPKELPISISSTNLSVVINGISITEGQFQCVFDIFGEKLFTDAIRTSSGVSCITIKGRDICIFPIFQS